jgi:hypothetical protein
MQILLTLTALAAITLALGGKSSLCLRHQVLVGRPTSRR